MCESLQRGLPELGKSLLTRISQFFVGYLSLDPSKHPFHQVKAVGEEAALAIFKASRDMDASDSGSVGEDGSPGEAQSSLLYEAEGEGSAQPSEARDEGSARPSLPSEAADEGSALRSMPSEARESEGSALPPVPSEARESEGSALPSVPSEAREREGATLPYMPSEAQGDEGGLDGADVTWETASPQKLDRMIRVAELKLEAKRLNLNCNP